MRLNFKDYIKLIEHLRYLRELYDQQPEDYLSDEDIELCNQLDDLITKYGYFVSESLYHRCHR